MEYVDLSAYIDVPVLIGVYVLVELCKRIFLKTDELRSWIPLISTILGSILSAIIFKLYPDGSSSVNIFNAIICGAISGSAATGCNQIYKHIKKFFTTNNNESNSEDY